MKLFLNQYPVYRIVLKKATMGFEPMIRVLQDPTAAIQTLARLSSDSV